MKVLVFGLSSQFGGVESFILGHVKAAVELDPTLEFSFVVSERIPEYAFPLKDLFDFRVIPSRWMHPFRYARSGHLLFESGEFDAFWANLCTLSDISLIKIAHKHGVPCVVHSHNSENMGNRANLLLHQIHKKQISGYASRYFACSDRSGDFMFPDWGEGAHGDSIIPNSINVAQFSYSSEARALARCALGVADDCMLFGTVGRLHFQKNQSFLLDLFAKVHELRPSSKLLIVGSGPLESELRNRAVQNGIADRVLFVTDCMDASAYYSAMDCFLFPSLFEGFGIAAIEAQCSGLACVVSKGVDSSVDVLDSVVHLSLDAPIECWTAAAIAAADATVKSRRTEAANVIKRSIYNMDNSIALLVKLLHESVVRKSA